MIKFTSLVIIFTFLFFLGSGCGVVNNKESGDVRARINFANQYSDQYPISGVSFSARGEERKTLEISTISSRAQADMSTTVEMLVSDELKNNAKAFGFEEIVVEAYGDSWTDGSKSRRIALK